MFRLPRTLLAGTALAVGLAGLTGCNSSSDAPVGGTDERPTAETTEAEKPSPAADGNKPEWAEALTVKGDKLTTIAVGDLTVDVYQVGTAKSTREGMYVHPDSGERVLKVGDELVVVNYVVTNVGSKPVPLPSILVDISVHFDSSKYYNSPEGDSSVLEAMGLPSASKAIDRQSTSGSDNYVYILEPGQAYSVGDTFQRQEGNAVTFSVYYYPATADGKLDTDNKVDEVEAKATLK
jgi:hypothetical protein